MPIVSFDFSANHIQRAIDYFKATRGWPGTALPGETEGQFAKRMWLEDLRSAVQRYEHDTLAKQAIATAPEDITAT
jgi:hypothetical protein